VASAYLSPRAVADRLGLAKPDSILAAIHAGELDAVDVSRPGAKRATWRIAQSALDKFLESRRAVPTPKFNRRTRRKPLTDVVEYF